MHQFTSLFSKYVLLPPSIFSVCNISSEYFLSMYSFTWVFYQRVSFHLNIFSVCIALPIFCLWHRFRRFIYALVYIYIHLLLLLSVIKLYYVIYITYLHFYLYHESFPVLIIMMIIIMFLIKDWSVTDSAMFINHVLTVTVLGYKPDLMSNLF